MQIRPPTPEESSARLEQLADTILLYPGRFDMADWLKMPREASILIASTTSVCTVGKMRQLGMTVDSVERCGTIGCIGGWTALIWQDEIPVNLEADPYFSIERAAQEILGLDDDTATWLFNSAAEHDTAEKAAVVLRGLAMHVRKYGTTDTYLDSIE